MVDWSSVDAKSTAGIFASGVATLIAWNISREPPGSSHTKRDQSAVKANRPVTSTNSKSPAPKPAWGREAKPHLLNLAVCGAIMAFAPVFVIIVQITLQYFNGSLVDCFLDLGRATTSPKDLLAWCVRYCPRPSWEDGKVYITWVAFQGILYAVLPSMIGYGQQTPAGHVLPYRVNGLLAWTVTHCLFIYGAWVAGWWSPAIIANRWPGLVISMNVYGYLLTGFCYLKAHVAPSHPNDRKFSGSRIYDLYMGIEMNPRFGKFWDFKLFHNGRPGIVGWTLIDISYAAWQYEHFGYVTNSMVIVNILHMIYVVDFFYNEDWYLRTIDIAHDHFGFYLSWGDPVWLPTMYTLQAQYLARYPIDLPFLGAVGSLGLGLFGYWLFRSVNYQKDLVRRTNGDCEIWGKKAKVIRAKYATSDGILHESLLLCSGWWGVVRHANYLGDLALSFAMCLACGMTNLLPYFYIIYMTILLIQRCGRDNARCTGKYGAYWQEYKKQVPYILIPGIY